MKKLITTIKQNKMNRPNEISQWEQLIEYKKLISSALPVASFFNFVDNIDDTHYGFEIAVAPYHTIRFLVSMNFETHIVIMSYRVDVYSVSLSVKELWRGVIPTNKDGKPDYEFIGKMLANVEKLHTP